MSLRKASVLDMATAAYELDAAVKRGILHRVDGRWMIMGEDLDGVLQRFEGQEIVLIAASLCAAAELPSKKYLNLDAIKTMVAAAEAEAKK